MLLSHTPIFDSYSIIAPTLIYVKSKNTKNASCGKLDENDEKNMLIYDPHTNTFWRKEETDNLTLTHKNVGKLLFGST